MIEEYEQFVSKVKNITSHKPTANVCKTRKVTKDNRYLNYDKEVVAEKEKFETLSDSDKIEYLSQAFRAQQLLDAKVYDIGCRNHPKIKQGEPIVEKPNIQNGYKFENSFFNTKLSLNRLEKRTDE